MPFRAINNIDNSQLFKVLIIYYFSESLLLSKKMNASFLMIAKRLKILSFCLQYFNFFSRKEKTLKNYVKYIKIYDAWNNIRKLSAGKQNY